MVLLILVAQAYNLTAVPSRREISIEH